MSEHSQFTLLGKRRFGPFFATQALGAFNDNAFRQGMVVLIGFHLGLTIEAVSFYAMIAPAVFILPFFLFSASAGQIAEKFEKARLIRYVKLFEIAAMALALFGFYTHNVGLLLTVLFLMGVHSATFGPIKYAILPQALQPVELLGGNALIETGTQLAMLLGLILGSALIEVGSAGPLLAGTLTLTLAVIGYLASRAIPPAPATAPGLRFNWNPFTETARVLAITRSDCAVFHAVLAISWYWFYATVLIAQLPNYTRLNLGGDGSVAVLVLTLFSIGTGAGALLCEHLSARRVEIGLVPLGALGLAVFGIDLYFARPGLALQQGLDWLAFLRGAGSVRIALDLALIGMFAGVFVVPLFAFIQQRTPSDRLSRVIAGNNIINALLICLAAGFGLSLDRLGFGVPQIFLSAALLGVLFVGVIFVRVPEFVSRFGVWARLNRHGA